MVVVDTLATGYAQGYGRTIPAPPRCSFLTLKIYIEILAL